MNHTPGPWYFTASDADGVMITDRRGAQIALWPPSGGTLENCANGRLLAAAPELLAALLDALPYVEDVLADPGQLACFKPGIVKKHAAAVRAAITKATGA